MREQELLENIIKGSNEEQYGALCGTPNCELAHSVDCLTCDDTGYIDNPDYKDDRDSVALVCPDCTEE